MKLKPNHLLAFALLLLISICFPDNCVAQRFSKEPILFDKDGENGLIIGTITFTHPLPKYDSYFPWIASLSDDPKTAKNDSSQIAITPTQMHSGELDGGKTYLFVIEKVPGLYSIPSIRMSKTKRGGATSDVFITGFNIPFGLLKGQILYIGEITINEYAEKDKTIVTIADKFERNIQVLKNVQPLVDWDAAVKSQLQIIHNK